MPFCKLCFDLGRPSFNNHNVRDSARNTTCPYLLNNKCRNCGYYGHTSSYCKMPHYLNPILNKPPPKHIDIVKSHTKSTNAFELLCMEVRKCLMTYKHQYQEDDNDDNELLELSKVNWGKGFLKNLGQTWLTAK